MGGARMRFIYGRVQGLRHVGFEPIHNVPENALSSGDFWLQLNATCF